MSALHHLALGTPDVERLSRFYRDVLDLPQISHQLHADGTLRSVWLDLGGAVLMIEFSVESAQRVIGVGRGLFLFALAVPAERRGEYEERLRAAACEIESRSDWTSYTRDPDGNRLAISAYPLHELARGR